MISSHPLKIHRHFSTKSSVTSQLLGSHGSPHRIMPPFPDGASASPTMSRHSASSSQSSPALIRLSRILGRGKKSSQGWCTVVSCVSVGLKKYGTFHALVTLYTGSVPKGDTQSSSHIIGIVIPNVFMFSIKPRNKLNCTSGISESDIGSGLGLLRL